MASQRILMNYRQLRTVAKQIGKLNATYYRDVKSMFAACKQLNLSAQEMTAISAAVDRIKSTYDAFAKMIGDETGGLVKELSDAAKLYEQADDETQSTIGSIRV